jgi:TPR repeat protein
LAINLKAFGPEHPEVAKSYNRIGSAYAYKGEYDEAIGYIEKDLGIRLKTLGPEHPRVAESYNRIGNAYAYKGEHDEAIDSFKKALVIRLKVSGPKHPHVADVHSNMGDAYLTKGERGLSVESYEKALSVRMKAFGAVHPQVESSHAALGQVFSMTGNSEKAVFHYEKAIFSRIKGFGPTNFGLASYYGSIANIYLKEGEVEKAEDFFAKSNAIYFIKPNLPSGAYRHPPTGLLFPTMLADLQLGKISDYRRNEDALGKDVRVGYNAPGIKLTVYVTSRNLATLNREQKKEAFRRYYESSAGDVMQSESYQGQKRISDRVSKLGEGVSDLKIQSTQFTYLELGKKKISYLYLTIYKDYFFKIRYTYDVDRVAKAEKVLVELLLKFGDSLNPKAEDALEPEFQATKRLAEGGDKVAQFNLAKLYAKGEGVPPDFKESAKWFTKAAKQGHASAQLDLGVAYDAGLGVPQDFKLAVKWYTKAAEQGHAKAQGFLGLMYIKGNGVLKDYKLAVKWITKAAEQGDAVAQFNLGLMYAYGDGVPKDAVRAYAWTLVARANGHDAKANSDDLERHMTAEQFAEAKELAIEILVRTKNNKD